jgi:HemY protein
VLLTAAAQEREAGEPEAATERVLKAIKLAPDLVPAAVLAARLMVRRGDLRKAAKIIETAWRAGPHPDLAKTYVSLRTGDSVRDRMARAETLAKISSWHPEARLAMAQAAYEAREFGKAREALAPLLADRPTVRACLAMARLEETEHGAGSGRAREWLARAAHAPRDPLWIADGVASETWAPVSPVSGRLDAFAWKTPTEVLAGPNATGADDEAGPASEPAQLAPSGPAPAQPGTIAGAPAPTPEVKAPTVPVPTDSKAGEAEPVKPNGVAPVAAGMAQAAADVSETPAGPPASGTTSPVVFPPVRTGDDAKPRRAG